MPIVEVDIVLRADEVLDRTIAGRLANGVASVLGSGPQGTWVRLNPIERDRYAENGEDAPKVHPVFVRVLKKELGVDEDLEKEAMSIAEIVADLLGRPRENVHIIYEPPAAGRIAFGGKLLR